ncbi:hypothetical protein BJ138DRAFT_1132565 [Hygrophoropsis aurantiaca]|uniref:Uncharacterized protein n=1 Tax=Hygrophoropsis aurantiaca TaxID=72124 RepID=A0ACB8AQN3_9AGAM|nr:hypothetical protein BJ138DRAFT_1132565 [Hygrophoropsis aurantiaca]
MHRSNSPLLYQRSTISLIPPASGPSRTPAPRYRHAEPSGPWPWVDFSKDLDPIQSCSTAPAQPLQNDWEGYPQSLFGNWTLERVERSKMLSSCLDTDECSILRVDVRENGNFVDNPPEGTGMHHSKELTWEMIRKPLWFKRPEGISVRVLFLSNLSRSMVQMLGTQYNIEPFFFSSSVNWIPSQYQEDVRAGEGDQRPDITITLPFMRTIRDPHGLRSLTNNSGYPSSSQAIDARPGTPPTAIDTQASLYLSSNHQTLLTDLLAIHMVRTVAPNSSTIISYHPGICSQRTSAQMLHSLILRASESVYWHKIFCASKDPTFVLIAILWYALYSWDEALEKMYEHINHLESRVILRKDGADLTVEMHILQAHLLHYISLLDEFRRSVDFVLKTPNPAVESKSYGDDEREHSRQLMKIARLQGRRQMQSSRLKNAMDLAFATINIEDSHHMRELTEAASRDSAAMKELTERAISYLTMIFLPASFTAAVFGMNVMEIVPGSNETLIRYGEVTLALTLLTVWLVFAIQVRNPIHGIGGDSGLFTRRLWWGESHQSWPR